MELEYVICLGICSIDVKVLSVGEELQQETLPLQMGHRVYQLHGLKASMWYEVKISYPASVRIFFSRHSLFIQLLYENLYKDNKK